MTPPRGGPFHHWYSWIDTVLYVEFQQHERLAQIGGTIVVFDGDCEVERLVPPPAQ